MSVNNDQTRLKHMWQASHEIIQFTKAAKRDDLETDIKLLRAVCMSLGIIGEAANYVSEEFQRQHAEIIWGKIIGMRNFIIHQYFYVDNDIVWDTATQAVPTLIDQL
jgi:uncharacterized protein with HEPN domain